MRTFKRSGRPIPLASNSSYLPLLDAAFRIPVFDNPGPNPLDGNYRITSLKAPDGEVLENVWFVAELLGITIWTDDDYAIVSHPLSSLLSRS